MPHKASSGGPGPSKPRKQSSAKQKSTSTSTSMTNHNHSPVHSRRSSDGSPVSGADSGMAGGGGGTQKDKDMAEAEAKRRKIQRACDACRRKKIKCDGPMNSLSTSKCAHCQEYGIECTYVEAAKRRGPPKGYIETLEQRCSRLEKLIHQLQPAVNIDSYVGPPLDRDDFDLAAYQETLRSLDIPPYPTAKSLPSLIAKSSPAASIGSPAVAAPSPLAHVLGSSPWRAYERDAARPADDDDHEVADDARMQEHIAHSMNRLNVRDAQWHYHGKASGAHLMRTFNDMRYGDHLQSRDFITDVNESKREQFWHLPEWEVVVSNENVHPLDYSVWPDEALADQLIDAYFDYANLYLPLLNRPRFLTQYHSGLWKTDALFARVCLMVFANGSRFVDDPRLYWPVSMATSDEGRQRMQTDRDGSLKYSAGWKYLQVLLRAGKTVMRPPHLYDMQCQVLICTFLQGSAIPHLTWMVSGIGLRGAQEIGIHVRSTMLNADPAERALYNRAFWCLYHIDRENCAWIGRSVALQDTDFDIDYPICVDDEYWDTSGGTGDHKLDFKQPPGKGPSMVAAFVQTLKLDHIMGAALRTIYAINKLPEHRADPDAQQAVVLELDSALNAWADGVPDELRWDPSKSDYKLFQQSSVLYAYYYYCQIMIHRPFIPTPAKSKSQMGQSSLAICANAARSICNILDAALRRGRQAGCLPGRALHAALLLPSWIAAIVTLINIYMGKQTPTDRERSVTDIKRCLAASRELEMTWRHAGKMTDMLAVLAAEEDLPTPGIILHGSKRGRDRVREPEQTQETPSSTDGVRKKVSSMSDLCARTPDSHEHTTGRSSVERTEDVLGSARPTQPTSFERVTTPPAAFGLGPFGHNNNNNSINGAGYESRQTSARASFSNGSNQPLNPIQPDTSGASIPSSTFQRPQQAQQPQNQPPFYTTNANINPQLGVNANVGFTPTPSQNPPIDSFQFPSQPSGFFDPNSFENQLFDLGTTMLSGQEAADGLGLGMGLGSDAWTAFLGEFVNAEDGQETSQWGTNFWTPNPPAGQPQQQNQQRYPDPSVLNQTPPQMPQMPPMYPPFQGRW